MENQDTQKQELYDSEQILEPMTKEQLDPKNWRPCADMVFTDEEVKENPKSHQRRFSFLKSEVLF